MAELIGDVMVETPEHDKQQEVAARDSIRTLVDFGEWLSAEGVDLMRYGKVEDSRSCSLLPGIRGCGGRGWVWKGHQFDSGEPYELKSGSQADAHRMMKCSECDGTGFRMVEVEDWVPAEPFRRLAFRFLGIDESKLEDERRALLDAVLAARS